MFDSETKTYYIANQEHILLLMHTVMKMVGGCTADLPSELRSLPRDLSSSFYKLLKTLLFGRAWAGSASE